MIKWIKILLVSFLLTATINVSAQDIVKWKAADLEKFIKETEKPTVVNFWATFCKPCIEEIPYFQEAVKKYDSLGVQLILVSLDLPKVYNNQLKDIARKLKITAPIKWLDESNADVFCPVADPKWSGAIPATLFINNRTGYRAFFEDQLSKDKMNTELQKLTAVR